MENTDELLPRRPAWLTRAPPHPTFPPPQAYKRGDWPLARSHLEYCTSLRTDLLGRPLKDVPSDVLLEYMRGLDFVAPPTWR